MRTRIVAIFLVCFVMAVALAAQSPLPPPEVTEAGVVNGASFQSGSVAPGSLISIFGTNLGLQLVNSATTPITALADEIPLGTSLGGHSIVFSNGASEVEAPLVFVSGPANQINAQVPWQIANMQGVRMVVRVDDGADGMTESQPVNISTADISPAFFTFDFGPGRAVAVNVKVSAEDDVINGSLAQPEGGSLPNAQPAPQGGFLIIYANGLGPVDPPAVTGNASLDALRTALQMPTVTVGADNLPANVQFAGLAPEFVGVYQINVILPENVPPGGQVPIRLSVGGIQSRDDVTIAVRARP